MLKEELLKHGEMEVGLSKLAGHQDFLTISFTNSALSQTDVVYILNQIMYVGKKLTIPFFDISGREKPKGNN